SNAVTGFNATNTTTGDVFLSNTAALLTITGISETGGNTLVLNGAPGGGMTTTGTINGNNVHLGANGTVTIGAAVTGSGTVDVETFGPASDMVLNASVTSTGSSVFVGAIHTLTMTAGVTVSSPTGV